MLRAYNKLVDSLSSVGRKIFKILKKLFNFNSSTSNQIENNFSQLPTVQRALKVRRNSKTTQKSSQEEKTLETYTKLLEERIVFLGKEIDDEIANTIVAQLLYLEDEDPQKDIYLYINSFGGSVSSSMAIYDTMEHISPNISTICVGVAGGIAALLLAAGTKGKRFSLPNTQIVLCQIMGSVMDSGQFLDIAVQARELTHMVDVINSCFAENTSQSVNKIREDNENNLHMNSLEALEYGLIDRVIDSTPHNLPQE